MTRKSSAQDGSEFKVIFFAMLGASRLLFNMSDVKSAQELTLRLASGSMLIKSHLSELGGSLKFSSRATVRLRAYIKNFF